MNNDAFWWYILLEAREKEAPVLDSLVELSGSIGAEYAEGSDMVRVRAYYRSSHDLGHWLKELNQVLGPWPDIVVRDMGKIANRSWHTAWKEAFPPLPVGKGLVVMAPWHKGNEPEGRLPLYIYPGSAFGTGYHESTQIALELLEKHLAPGDELVDVGCGSGILSIGAIKLGASRAWARISIPRWWRKCWKTVASTIFRKKIFSWKWEIFFRALIARYPFLPRTSS